jgi:hypothetical protein
MGKAHSQATQISFDQIISCRDSGHTAKRLATRRGKKKLILRQFGLLLGGSSSGSKGVVQFESDCRLCNPRIASVGHSSFQTAANRIELGLRLRLIDIVSPVVEAGKRPLAEQPSRHFVTVCHAPRAAVFPFFRTFAQIRSNRIAFNISKHGVKMVIVPRSETS